jgi:hypothetical protein
VRDPASVTGWKIEVGPFPGWAEVPEWQPFAAGGSAQPRGQGEVGGVSGGTKASSSDGMSTLISGS